MGLPFFFNYMIIMKIIKVFTHKLGIWITQEMLSKQNSFHDYCFSEKIGKFPTLKISWNLINTHLVSLDCKIKNKTPHIVNEGFKNAIVLLVLQNFLLLSPATPSFLNLMGTDIFLSIHLFEMIRYQLMQSFCKMQCLQCQCRGQAGFRLN